MRFSMLMFCSSSLRSCSAFVSLCAEVEIKKQFYISEGFAHGFLVLSDEAEFCYKVTDFYHPGDEGGLAWNDPSIGIEWPQVTGEYPGSADPSGYKLGVYEIVPVAMKRSVVKLDDKKAKTKIARWNSISESAAKQSKRSIIPEVSDVLTFRQA